MLKRLWQKIPTDKLLHFGAGLLIAILAGLCFGADWGLATAIVAGVVKEVYDWYDYGGPDIKDAIATWLGGSLGFLILLLLV